MDSTKTYKSTAPKLNTNISKWEKTQQQNASNLSSKDPSTSTAVTLESARITEKNLDEFIKICIFSVVAYFYSNPIKYYVLVKRISDREKRR